MAGMRYQPQRRAQVRPEWIARGAKFAFVPGFGFVNAVSQGAPTQTSGEPTVGASSAGKTYTGSARAEFDPIVEARNGLTVLAIIRSSESSNTYSNTTRFLASSRTSGNGGWTWGRSGASGGFTRQQIVFQGVATATEAGGYRIDPAVDTPIACRYDPVAGKITFFHFGVETSSSAIAIPRVSGALVLGAQGPFSSNISPWIDQSAGLVVVEGALTDAEIGQLTSSTGAFWQAFADEAGSEDDVPGTAVGYTLPVERAMLTLSSGQVGMRVSRRLRADPAALVLAGGDVSMRASRRLAVEGAALVMDAGQAGMLAARRMSVQPAALDLSTGPVSLLAARQLRVTPAALILTGGQVGMQYSPLPAPGSYTLPVSAAAMTLGGGNAGMRVSRRLTVGPAVLELATGAVRMLVGRRLQIEGARLELSGGNVSLRFSGQSAPIDVSKVHPSRLVMFDGSGSRVVVFEGSGSRVVVFEGSGKRLRINQMDIKVPTKVGTKWVVDRDRDEISYYGADITNELADRNTTALPDGVIPLLYGIELLDGPELQVATIEGVERTFVVVKLGGVDGPLPEDWRWVARVSCANGERFDKSTWFNEVDP